VSVSTTIINHRGQCIGHTSARRALRLVQSGQAFFIGQAVRLVQRPELGPAAAGDRTAIGYDRAPVSTLAKIRRIPVLMPERLLTEATRARMVRPRAYRSGGVRVILASPVASTD
jgi:hypothetical protein